MNRITTVFIILIMIAGCGVTEPEKDHFEVTFEFHTWYSATLVKLVVDKQLVFEDVVTTGEAMALAGTKTLTLAKGSHRFNVQANLFSDSQSFLLGNDIFIGIDYNHQAGSFDYTYSYQPFGHR